MVEGFVDASSLYSGIMALARQTPRDSFYTEWHQALTVTATLISSDHIKLLPHPRQEGPASGPYGILLKGLQDTVSPIILPESSKTAALRMTKQWAAQNVDKLRRALALFTAEGASLSSGDEAKWLDSAISVGWNEHIIRQRDMFDWDFLQQLASILNVSRSELEMAWTRSSDPSLEAVS